MGGKSGGLLIVAGVLLYFIISIGPYIIIGLVVIAIIAAIVFFSINSTTKPSIKERHVYVQLDKTKSINPIRVARVPPSSLNSISFVEDQKLIQSLVKAYNEVDNSLDTNNWIIRMLRYSSKFYSKKAFKDKNLFSFIIEEANNAILNAKQTSGRPKLIHECETIITEMGQLRNGVAIESIVKQYIGNKKQTDQLLIEQKTRNNRPELKNLNTKAGDLKKSNIEGGVTLIEQKEPYLSEEGSAPVKKSIDYNKEFKLLIGLLEAHRRAGKTIEMSNLLIRLMKWGQLFYRNEAFKESGLFDYIIKETNGFRSTLDSNLQQLEIVECEIIISEFKKLRGGNSIEYIISHYSENKQQISRKISEEDAYVSIGQSNDVQESKGNNVENDYTHHIHEKSNPKTKQIIEAIGNGIKNENIGLKRDAICFFRIGAELALNYSDLYYFKAQKRLIGLYNSLGNEDEEFSALKSATENLEHTSLHIENSKEQWIRRIKEIENERSQKNDSPNSVTETIFISTNISKEPYEHEFINPDDKSDGLKKLIGGVPFWTHYYVYSSDGINSASQDQKDFYAFFKNSFLKGIYIDIEGNLNYSFILLFDLICDYKNHKDLARVIDELIVLGVKYPKTKRYIMQSLEGAIAQEAGIDSLSKDHLVVSQEVEEFRRIFIIKTKNFESAVKKLNESETIGLVNNSEYEKNELIQSWDSLRIDRKSTKKRLSKNVETPVTVFKETAENIFKITKPDTFTIDTDKLHRIEQDSVKTSQLLSSIFSSEESNLEEISQQKSYNEIIKILTLLLANDSWNRSDVQQICTENNVTIGSILESINDYSYNLINEAVIDDDGEKIYIATEYKKQLLCQL